MDEKEILELLKKYQKQELSEKEADKIEAWYLNKASSNNKGLNKQELEESYKRLKLALPLKQDVKVISLWRRVAVAASIAVFLAFGVFYLFNSNKPETSVVNEVKDISPGGKRGVLTLSDGTQIELTSLQTNDTIINQGENDEIAIKMLSSGQVTYAVNGNGKTNQSAEVAYNTLSTPIGGQYNLVLADGTKVYLNALSSIKYPTQFNANTRTVEIQGEVYFEVSKDKNRPFIVKSNQQSIEVLGTHFNVNAYQNEDAIKTTLLEGSVAVSYNNSKVILKPGEQANVAKQKGEITVEEVDSEIAVAWIKGRFKFNNADIKMVMKQLQRWYDIDVEYRGEVPDIQFSGGTFMNKNLSEVLKVLELSDIKFKIEGQTVIVNP